MQDNGFKILDLVPEIDDKWALAGLVVAVLYLLYRALIKGPLGKQLQNQQAFILLNRLMTWIFILALVTIFLVLLPGFLSAVGIGKANAGPDHISRILEYEHLDAKVKESRDWIDHRLNERKDNLSAIGFPEDADKAQRARFYAQMARSFHDDPEVENEKARSYAERGAGLKVEGLDSGISHVILASTHLFDQNAGREKYERASRAIEEGKRILGKLSGESPSRLHAKYAALLRDYEAHYYFRRPTPDERAAADLCLEGIDQALEDRDLFALSRYLYRLLDVTTSVVYGQLYPADWREPSEARKPEVDEYWRDALERGIDAFERYEEMVEDAGSRVSGRTAQLYLSTLELSLRPALRERPGQDGGGLAEAYETLDSALRKHEPAAERWGAAARFPRNRAYYRVMRAVWYARRLILAHELGVDEDLFPAWRRVVRAGLDELEQDASLAERLDRTVHDTFLELQRVDEESAGRIDDHYSRPRPGVQV